MNPDDIETESEAISTYSDMFAEYLSSQDWISDADKPLVHMLRDICRQIDADPSAGLGGHLAGRYLAAVDRLDKRRPRKVAPADRDRHPDQTDIFDFID